MADRYKQDADGLKRLISSQSFNSGQERFTKFKQDMEAGVVSVHNNKLENGKAMNGSVENKMNGQKET